MTVLENGTTGPQMLLRLALVAILLALPFSAGMLRAAAPHTISITRSARTVLERPDFPVPHDKNQVLFLQRSMNSNTVVYAARLDKAGKLDAAAPLEVYWRRFNNEGQRKALGTFERLLAFGVTTRPGNRKGTYVVAFRALPRRKMTLRLDDDGRPELITTIGPHLVRPIYIFVDLDDSSLVPKVQYLYLHGVDVKTGQAWAETIAVSGGDPAD